MNIFPPYRLLLLSLIVLLTSTATAPAASIKDTAYTTTLEIYARLPGAGTPPGAADERLIRALSYTGMRAFRALCSLPALTRDQAATALRRLPTTTIRYEHMPLLEKLVAINGATVDDCWRLIDRLAPVDFVTARALAGLAHVAAMTVDDLFVLIDRIAELDEPGRWAAASLFSVTAITAAETRRGLELIDELGERQRWAAEQQCRIPGITAREALAGLERLQYLGESDAWNARALFMQPGMTADLAAAWLRRYFSIPGPEREEAFLRLSPGDRTILLRVFAAAADYPLWRINNLHDITDARGREIGSGTLAGYSGDRLLTLLHRLPLVVQRQYGTGMRRALQLGNRGEAVAVLRRATAAARQQTAVDLTSANIYVLLAHGSDLYDSSFRDILVPVLKERIGASFGNDLLSFLVATDPEGIFASDCIASLAQKGKLTDFLPTDPARQQQVLDLVARSALQSEFSLILFSATFGRILETIAPPARSYLIGLLLDAAASANGLFSRQVRIILQYYLDEYPALLTAADKTGIGGMLATLGPIDLAPYTRTPFAEWAADGRLQSLSVFQDDDDGRSSYLSNSRTLLAGGYRPQLSAIYSLPGLSTSAAAAARSAVAAVAAGGEGLGRLLQLAAAHPLVVDWSRTINGLAISHSVFVYQGKTTQQHLLARFLRSRSEMFAQRGHSYWRREQLLDPLADLLAAGGITPADLRAKQRFLSIGSCGGIRAYSELNRMFYNHVDILATIGTGKTTINNPYNRQIFEIIARHRGGLSWEELARQSADIFHRNLGDDYLQPGSLPAILHKIMDLKPKNDAPDQTRRTPATAR
ncbi:hypothetical protein JWG42_11180 [Desulfoprunum benzoelyticum]|uniref:Uncharacterized protein n=1 Tax=Desulfoprunum benzoelyticum TaxID=1506996 RepID=A0A840V418_9BACT|nr:hypothetical protein [Desulfoprunum benzoelyticum]MBB5347851.1 hypothetical protein [Desulfoprunum benzoelyticum]MBM9530712.1 hypothetical protein [Desulfoprunum benzoelyticum]